jgi:hypothetical protein
MVRLAKRQHVCDRITNASSSRKLFQWCGEMMDGAVVKALPKTPDPTTLANTFSDFFSG